MTTRDVEKLLASALDRGLILNFVRQHRGWQVREPHVTTTLTDAEALVYARRIKERLVEGERA
jgi:hypothetical protein